MATIRVTPLPDGESLRGSWQVQKNGRQVSIHRKKTAAKRAARSKADRMDSLVFHRKDGTVMG